jgi:RNA ligase
MSLPQVATLSLDALLDRDKLSYHVRHGNIGLNVHPALPLTIYNYTHQAQRTPGIWGDGCIDYCRGLIVDELGLIVARPFKKFHNLNTASIPESLEANLPNVEPLVLEKLDGSLGIYWEYEGRYGVATRGSFTSDQAKWATEHLYKHYEVVDVKRTWPEDYTPLFEIIYDDNRIVCRYDFQGLVLLGLVHRQTGFEMPHYIAEGLGEMNGIRVVKQHKKTLSQMVAENEAGREGYVLSYYTSGTTPPVKVKVKFADYVRLHRIVTGVNPKHIWEMMAAGQSFAVFNETPEHFKEWAHSWRRTLGHRYATILREAMEIWVNRPIFQPGYDRKLYRKRLALHFQERAGAKKYLLPVLFAELDGHDVRPVIWKILKPGGGHSFREDEASKLQDLSGSQEEPESYALDMQRKESQPTQLK